MKGTFLSKLVAQVNISREHANFHSQHSRWTGCGLHFFGPGSNLMTTLNRPDLTFLFPSKSGLISFQVFSAQNFQSWFWSSHYENCLDFFQRWFTELHDFSLQSFDNIHNTFSRPVDKICYFYDSLKKIVIFPVLIW